MEKMKDVIVIAINTVRDYFLICKGCIKAYISTKKAGILSPKGTIKLTAHMMYQAHRNKIFAYKNRNKIEPIEGEYLDRWAELYGIERNGRTDEELRAAIIEFKEWREKLKEVD